MRHAHLEANPVPDCYTVIGVESSKGKTIKKFI